MTKPVVTHQVGIIRKLCILAEGSQKGLQGTRSFLMDWVTDLKINKYVVHRLVTP